ncbi:MAG TPA: methyltransferase domain-containing protein [Burkholderiaceae bacterium]|nr:methyltransferase domain-containing protein [Burkholderiaceae bacterium]
MKLLARLRALCGFAFVPNALRGLASAATAAVVLAGCAAPHPVPSATAHGAASPYVPSPDSVVAEMLRMADVGPGDFVIDLGSGDGRIVLTAAKVYGARGVGVEIQDALIASSNEAARREHVADRARFMRQDLFETDLSPASVVTIYLVQETVNRLAPKLQRELRPGARVLSHDYPIEGWRPIAHRTLQIEEKKRVTGVGTAVIYLYRVPDSFANPR